MDYTALTAGDQLAQVDARIGALEVEHFTTRTALDELTADPHADDAQRTSLTEALETLEARHAYLIEQRHTLDVAARVEASEADATATGPDQQGTPAGVGTGAPGGAPR